MQLEAEVFQIKSGEGYKDHIRLISPFHKTQERERTWFRRDNLCLDRVVLYLIKKMSTDINS